MTAEELTRRLDGVKRSATGWTARCPAHEDRQSSLSIGTGTDGRVLLHCFAGCTPEAICDRLGIKVGDLMPERRPQSRVVANYDYTDATGKPLIRVVRLEPKSFRRQRPDGHGGWSWGGTDRVIALYRHVEMLRALDAEATTTVYMVEGEKDVDNARRIGLTAVCPLGGASNWSDDYATMLERARRVVIIADNDEPGRKHALRARAAMRVHNIECVAVNLPSEINGRRVKDVSDAISAGWSAADIVAHCESCDEVDHRPAESTADPSEGTGDGLGERIRTAIAAETARLEHPVGAARRREIIIQVALDYLREHGALYHDESDSRSDGVSYYLDRDADRLWQLETPAWHHRLADISQLNRVGMDYRYLQTAIEDAAACASWSRHVEGRYFWARVGDVIYMSCGETRIARISAGDVRIVDNGTDDILMRLGRTMAEWHLVPREETLPLWSMRVLGDIATPGNELAPLLIALWVLGLPAGTESRPPLSLCGDVGSGKTRTATGIYEVLGLEPRITGADKSDKGEDSFWASVAFGGISTIDNVDSSVKWLPDAVASGSTGGSREHRKLYTDAEVSRLVARAGVILTSANPRYATDPGLADRLINVEFARPTDRRAVDSGLSNEITANRDRLMSWIAWTLADALSVSVTPPSDLNHRHPDWGEWAWRCGVALGCQDETEQVLRRAEADKHYISVISDAVYGSVIYRVMGEVETPWEGSAADLLALIKQGSGGTCTRTGLICHCTPESYDGSVGEHITPRTVGRYLRTAKVALHEVFGMSTRLLHGNTLYTFRAPKLRDEVGEVAHNTPFLSSLYSFFAKKKDKNGSSNPPNPPEPPSAVADDDAPPF